MAKTKDMFDHYSQFRVHTMHWNLLYIAWKFYNFFKKNGISNHSCVLFNSINQVEKNFIAYCKCKNVTEYLQVGRDYAMNLCAYFYYCIN